MITIHITPAPVIRFEAVERGWCATVDGEHVAKGLGYYETLGKALTNLIDNDRVAVIITS